jgi:hypothetical protein
MRSSLAPLAGALQQRMVPVKKDRPSAGLRQLLAVVGQREGNDVGSECGVRAGMP